MVQRRLDLLQQEGIRFVCNANVGENVEAQLLLRDFDATVICTGATQPRDLRIEGRDLAGVHFAMDYLTASTKALLNGGADHSPIHARGRDVVVIGGGDTGTDCVGTAMRQGCRSLLQIEILPKPPVERAPDNPWPEWPKVYKLDYGQEEAAARFGADPRAYVSTVKRFVGRRRWEARGDRHRRGAMATQRPGTVAAGRTARHGTHAARAARAASRWVSSVPSSHCSRTSGVDCDARSNVRAEYGRYATSLTGVFTAGDCRRGQSLIVWAIAEGRGAARECDRYLMGRTDLP